MIETVGIPLARGWVEALVMPQAGGVLSQLRVGGRSVLATTEWPHDRLRSVGPALTEAEWVDRWRGGWQLCFPSAGEADPASPWPQGFHGVASHAAWRVVAQEGDRIDLEWSDDHGLTARRSWRLTETGVEVETEARNDGERDRPLVVAEHLILGGDVLAPVVSGDCVARIVPDGHALLAELHYDGTPTGDRAPWPGAASADWARVHRHTPARVAALVDVDPRLIRIEAPHVAVSIAWRGLPHALLWEELAQSGEPPWNKAVVALGVEPTSAPHGRGTAADDGVVLLAPGGTLTWSATLAIAWRDRLASTPPTPTPPPTTAPEAP